MDMKTRYEGVIEGVIEGVNIPAVITPIVLKEVC
jgi:hypothetical protein